MKILSIDKVIANSTLHIDTITLSELTKNIDLSPYDYIIISGGDGTIRRVLKQIHAHKHLPPFILNPTGSFNVIAKLHRVPKLAHVLHRLEEGQTLQSNTQKVYKLNEEVFLFSAGNMGDLQHIFLSENLRFGVLKKGLGKYILALLLLLPAHLLMTPFMLLSKQRFFIFTPLGIIKKFGSFYGRVEEMNIRLDNLYNFVELDGDVVTIETSTLTIGTLGSVEIVIE